MDILGLKEDNYKYVDVLGLFRGFYYNLYY